MRVASKYEAARGVYHRLVHLEKSAHLGEGRHVVNRRPTACL